MKTIIKALKLSTLEMQQNNPQRMHDEVYQQLVASIKRRGWYFSLADVWEYETEKYRVVSGHHRIQAAIDAGVEQHEVNVITDTEYTELRWKLDTIEANRRRGFLDMSAVDEYLSDVRNVITPEEIETETGVMQYEDVDITYFHEKKEAVKSKTEKVCPHCGKKI